MEKVRQPDQPDKLKINRQVVFTYTDPLTSEVKSLPISEWKIGGTTVYTIGNADLKSTSLDNSPDWVAQQLIAGDEKIAAKQALVRRIFEELTDPLK